VPASSTRVKSSTLRRSVFTTPDPFVWLVEVFDVEWLPQPLRKMTVIATAVAKLRVMVTASV
jgi:hypothetical protein